MKQITSFKTTMIILLTAILSVVASPSKSYAGNALEKARQMKEQTVATVSEVNEKISDCDADSLQKIVVLKTGASEVSEEAADADEGQGIDVGKIASDAADSTDSVAIVAIISGIAVPFGTLILIIYVICRSFTVRKRMKYDLIMRAIDAGHPLPPEFYMTDGPRNRNKLQSGIVWIGWGLALIILGLMRSRSVLIAAGMIPSFIGLSRLAVFYIEQKNEQQKKEEASDDAEQA